VGVELIDGENPRGHWATATLPEVFKGQPAERDPNGELFSDVLSEVE